MAMMADSSRFMMAVGNKFMMAMMAPKKCARHDQIVRLNNKCKKTIQENKNNTR